ncbi:MAG: hypothetical protein WBA67_18725, partial [Jannaschia sp.]
STQLTDLDVKLIDRTALSDTVFFHYLERISAGRVDAAAPVPTRVADDLTRLVSGPHQTVLATSEIMFSRLPLSDFYQHTAEALRMMGRLLPDYRIQVILYVRQQTAFVESCYTQLVQTGREITFEDYIGGDIPRHLDWARVCDDIAGAVGAENVTVRPFEVIRDMGSEGFLRDFLSIIGLSEDQMTSFSFDDALAEGATANRGFSQVAVDMARFTMPMLNPNQRKRLRKFLQDHFSTRDFPRPAYFTPDQAIAVAREYSESNARLFEAHMPDFDAARLGYLTA